MLETDSLVRVVGDRSAPVQPGHAKDGTHATKGRKRAVWETDRAGVRYGDQGDSESLRDILGEELAVRAVVTQAVDHRGASGAGNLQLELPSNRTEVWRWGCRRWKVGTIRGQDAKDRGHKVPRKSVNSEGFASADGPEVGDLGSEGGEERRKSRRSGKFISIQRFLERR
eukprot:2006200-Rhodomonas_salina.5